MNISLTPALEQFVNDKVATVLYNSVRDCRLGILAQQAKVSAVGSYKNQNS